MKEENLSNLFRVAHVVLLKEQFLGLGFVDAIDLTDGGESVLFA